MPSHAMGVAAPVVGLNRANPPDALLREVFSSARVTTHRLNDGTSLSSRGEVQALLKNYRTIKGLSCQPMES